MNTGDYQPSERPPDEDAVRTAHELNPLLPNVPRTIEGVVEPILICLEEWVSDGLLEPIRVTPIAESANFSLYTNPDGTFDLRRWVDEQIL
jgi:hypothetical protein